MIERSTSGSSELDSAAPIATSNHRLGESTHGLRSRKTSPTTRRGFRGHAGVRLLGAGARSGLCRLPPRW